MASKTASARCQRSFMKYRDMITMDPDKRGGQPCIRGLRITVYDVLYWLANGMTAAEIIEDFPELTHADIMACLAFAADRERIDGHTSRQTGVRDKTPARSGSLRAVLP